LTLLLTDELRAGLKSIKQGHAIGTQRPYWPHPSAMWIAHAEQFIALDEKLPDIVARKIQPANTAERIKLAQLCLVYKKHYAAAAKFYVESFAADPMFVVMHRLDAIRACVLAGTGQGKDAVTLDPPSRAKFRQQSLDLLRQQLAEMSKLLVGNPGSAGDIQTILLRWEQEPALAAVRNAQALTKLPQPEQKDWQAFWTEAGALLKKTKAGNDR
jgi:hypothetical protein